MSNSVPKTAEELKQFLRYLDHILLEQWKEKLKDYYRSILEAVDKVIADHRSPELQILIQAFIIFLTFSPKTEPTKMLVNLVK